ncbi:MAG TPA: DUF1207 domain-containing protein [Nitrospiria bacterium]|nr:DUF1207 domain-containing protein [Nitrospiria bacterium]
MRLVSGWVVLLGCCCLSGTVHAEAVVPGAPAFLPERLDYRPYIADPRRPRFGAGVLFGSGGELQFDTAIGGAFALANLKPGDPPFEKLQIAGSAAVLPRWDIHHDLDQVGANFRAGLSLSGSHGPWAMRLQVLHESDHLGDELILRTGLTKRLAYLRQEIDLGVSYFPHVDLRLYVEGSYGFSIGESNRPWKAQAGGEWEGGPPLPLGARLYAAGDLQTYQEVHWNVDWTAQAGVVDWNEQHTRSLRIFAENHIGHDPLGEFFSNRLNYNEMGFALDF